MQQPDKLTETRGSLDMKSSLLRRLYALMCPCFSCHQDKKSTHRNDIDYFASELSNRSSTREYQLPRKKSLDFSPYLSYKMPDAFLDRQLARDSHPSHQQSPKKGHKSKSFMHHPNHSPSKQRQTVRETLDLTRQLNAMTYTKKKEWYNFPIFREREGELILLGKHNKNLLAEISTVKLQPSPTAVQKQLALKLSPQKARMQKKLQDFWKSRYYYFEKFDEFIQIDKDSISTLTPQAVSDYIAGKCCDCKTALDAFSGIGHNATKLGTLCEKVICVQEQPKKCNMLINNAKCYEIYNIEFFIQPFLDINLKQKADVVLLHPILISEDYLLSSMCEPKHFKPALSQTIRKSLEVAHNLVLLLPPNISVKDVCYQISKSSEEIQHRLPCSCSVKIEKIYFRNVLSYVAVFFGPNVQQEIKINSELGFIYKLLKNSADKNFLYKKLIKYLREKYGMIKLLNFVSESVAIEREGMTEIEKLIEFIRQRKLILQHKLQDLLAQEKSTPRKVTIKETKDETTSPSNSPDLRTINTYSFQNSQQRQKEQLQEVEQAQTISQRTQSFYSSVSGFSAFKKRRPTIAQSMKRTEHEKHTHSDHHIERQSNTSSIVVKKIMMDDQGSLEKDSKSPASPTHYPGNPVWKSNIGGISGGNNNNNNSNSNQRAYRHTLESKTMERDMFTSDKQNLKRTLIEK